MINEGDIAIYIYRNTPSYAEGKKCMELVASVNKAPFEDIFFQGFCSSVRRLNRKYKADKIFIETTADSGLLYRYFNKKWSDI